MAQARDGDKHDQYEPGDLVATHIANERRNRISLLHFQSCFELFFGQCLGRGNNNAHSAAGARARFWTWLVRRVDVLANLLKDIELDGVTPSLTTNSKVAL